MENDKMIKIGEAAKMIGVRRETLREWDEKGSLTAIRTPGNRRLYKLSDIDRFLKEGSK